MFASAYFTTSYFKAVFGGQGSSGGAIAYADALETQGVLGPVEAIGFTPPQQEDLGGALRRYLRGAKRVPAGYRPPDLPKAEPKPLLPRAPARIGDTAEALPLVSLAHTPHSTASAGGGGEAAALLARGAIPGGIASAGGFTEMRGIESAAVLAGASAHGLHNPEDDEIALLVQYLLEVA